MSQLMLIYWHVIYLANISEFELATNPPLNNIFSAQYQC